MDLLPNVSLLIYFEKRSGSDASVKLGAVQSSILPALGLQRKTTERVEEYVEWSIR